MNRKKILVVDDNLVILETVSMKLIANGYDVVTAEDAAGAASATRKEKPDLILLDVSPPPNVAHGGALAWDGFTIMNWLRRLEGTKHIPIVIITGSDPVQYKERALAAGAVSFFHKPINNADMLTVIHDTLAKSAVEAEPPVGPVPEPVP